MWAAEVESQDKSVDLRRPMKKAEVMLGSLGMSSA